MSEHRVSILRDPRLAAEPIEQVARRYHAASPTGSTLTLLIVVIGLAVVGVAGAFAWGTSEVRGVVVLLGGAFVVGLFAGLAPPPVNGVRAILVAAIAITVVPVVLLAIGVVFTSGTDRDWALGALAVTSAGGAAMVALVVGGYALVRRLRVPVADRGLNDPIAAAVLARVRADLARGGTPVAGRELVCSASDDLAGHALLELETRLLTSAGYVETSRERVTVDAAPAAVLLDLASGVGGPGASPKVTIEASFAPPVAAAPGDPPRDPELDAAVARWRRVRRPGAGAPAVGSGGSVGSGGAGILDGAGSGIGAMAGLVIVVIALGAQVFGLLMLGYVEDVRPQTGAEPDPLQTAVSLALVGAVPFAIGCVAGLVWGRGAWWVAIVPVFGAIGFVLMTWGGWTGGELAAAAAAGAALSAPWALGWLLALGIRRLRREPDRVAGLRESAK